MPSVKLSCDVCGKLIENGDKAVQVSTGTVGRQLLGFFKSRRAYQVAHRDCLDIDAEDSSQYTRYVLDEAVGRPELESRVSKVEAEVNDFGSILERQIKINDEILDMVNNDK